MKKFFFGGGEPFARWFYALIRRGQLGDAQFWALDSRASVRLHLRYKTTGGLRMSPENSPQQAVTRLLAQWKEGKKEALDLLTPIVYDELRRLADHYLRNEHAAATLQPTALVHEAYLRLVGQSLPDWESRSHFFGVAAHLMRQILVD